MWDEYLIGPFSLLAEYPLLKEHQVSRMLKLDSEFPANPDFDNMVVLVRAELRVMKSLASFINK